MSYTRERMCDICSKVETIRKDSKSKVCKKCSCRLNASKAQKKRKMKLCKTCGKETPACNKWDNCSRACSSKGKRVTRKCKNCKVEFTILKCVLKTNASGNFCKRRCYDDWMCVTGRTNNYGSRWKKTRREVVEKFPFCSLCGTTKNIDVHHIIPYKKEYNNKKWNLIPLCKKHHKAVEYITIDILNANNGDIKLSRVILSTMLRERQAVVLAEIKKLKEDLWKIIN